MEFKPVESYLMDVDKQPVYYYIYCYYDALLDRFNQPYITNEEPSFMIESVKASVLKGQLEATKAKDLKFIFLGKFDIKTGDIVNNDEKICLVDLDLLIKQKEGIEPNG